MRRVGEAPIAVTQLSREPLRQPAVGDYSMSEVVHAVAIAMESLAAEKHLALKTEVVPDLPLGRGDVRRITQVLLNLVGNAIKFTEAGEVRVHVAQSDQGFMISVSDTGPGIAPSDQHRIFEEFQQVDSSSGQHLVASADGPVL